MTLPRVHTVGSGACPRTLMRCSDTRVRHRGVGATRGTLRFFPLFHKLTASNSHGEQLGLPGMEGVHQVGVYAGSARPFRATWGRCASYRHLQMISQAKGKTLSRDFFELVKNIGEAKSKQEEVTRRVMSAPRFARAYLSSRTRTS